jgi:hypothetical protein
MPDVTPTAPENIKWLLLQDCLRRRSQDIEDVKRKLHFVSLAIALVVPFASAIGTKMVAHGMPDISAALVGLLAIAALVIEYVGQFIKTRANKLHVISRRALAAAMASDAWGVAPPDEAWRRILEQSGVRDEEVARLAADQANTKMFGEWWASERPRAAGSERLQALLLENVFWTQAILKKMVVRRTKWRLIAFSGLVFLVFTAAILAPWSLPGIIEFLLVPLLLFALALNGLNTTDLEQWQDAVDEIDAIHDALKGIDNRNDRTSLSLALVARYIGLTSAVPPISSTVYDRIKNQLNLQMTHAVLERHLSGG